ncbi:MULTISPECIES: hypothetical protein [Roseateles]|uniref:Uncharacterized protein n=1 Tax=Roseateles albus TaxID=2987525 RepID=A0ABT5KFY2_9BURK|nr:MULTISPECIES: hypothetical protein [Roseateles]MCV2357434.1 hypothetical protein [Paucibacter sp. TC2R-5]MDC8772821.1 hypothetical protein [Roseateles albus]
MYRCAQSLVSCAFVIATLTVSAPALAQTHRPFPAQALRGDLVILQTPDVSLNGHAARLAPGARVRGDTNLLQQPASLSGVKLTVHYTLDPSGLLMDVWVLNPVELANKPWPRNLQEAESWSFDQASQVWTKR